MASSDGDYRDFRPNLDTGETPEQAARRLSKALFETSIEMVMRCRQTFPPDIEPVAFGDIRAVLYERIDDVIKLVRQEEKVKK